MAAPVVGARTSSSRLFPAGLPSKAWLEGIEVEGFTEPVSGVVFRGESFERPTCGMPLGGLDTGCVDLEANGMLGFSTIFNELVHPRHMINMPFLGVSLAGSSTLLASDTKAKRFAPRQPGTFTDSGGGGDYTPSFVDLPGLQGARTVDSIDYFGHYPVADLEMESKNLPISVGLRSFTPFVLGDTASSTIPAAVFDVYLRNNQPDAGAQEGTLAFSFPGLPEVNPPGQSEPTSVPVTRNRLRPVPGCALDGVSVDRVGGAFGEQWTMGYVLAVVSDSSGGENGVQVGGSLDTELARWEAIETALPAATAGESGASVAVKFSLAAGAHQRVRFVLAWHAPEWYASGNPATGGPTTNTYRHMYAKRLTSALATATHVATNADALLSRTLRWQSMIYSDSALRGKPWLADQLVNCLHLGTECSVWAQSSQRTTWCKPEDGIFALNECRASATLSSPTARLAGDS